MRVKCPRCSTIIAVEPNEEPVCPTCGFGRTAAPAPTQERRFAPPPPSPTAWPTVPRPPATPAPAAAHPGPTANPGPPAGKPRSFGISLLLVIVTLGIYGLVWAYKVFHEVDREHGYDHEQVWFWLGFIPYLGVIFVIMYYVKELRKLNLARQSRGLPVGITPGKFWLFYFLGIVTLLVTTILAYYQVQKSLNEMWGDVYARKRVPLPA